MSKIIKSVPFVIVTTACLCAGCNKINGTKNIEEQINNHPVYERAPSEEKSSTFMETYFSDEMPVFAFITMPSYHAIDGVGPGINPSFINYSTFETFKEAGFNVVCPLYERVGIEDIEIRRAIQICSDLDLKYVLRDVDFLCMVDELYEEPASFDYYKAKLADKWYLDEPCVIGIQTADEPNYRYFSSMGNFYRALADTRQDMWPFTTLVPSYGGADEWGYAEAMEEKGITDPWLGYQMFIDRYLDETKSSYVLYDYYLNHTGRFDMTPENTKGIMENFSYFNRVCRERGIKYMASVAAFRHGRGQVFSMKETRWTVNMSLAYGAKGIEYYSYWPTIGGNTSMSMWQNPSRMGLVTGNGIPHDTYAHIRDINAQIALVDEYLMPATFVGVQYYGAPTLHIQPLDIIKFPEYLVDIQSEGDAFVGVFEYNNKPLYYILNNSFDADVGITTFQAKFDRKVNVHLLNTNEDRTKNDTYSVAFDLSAGEAILMEIK